ncbi:MAG: glycoside hydrolase family 2 [Ruminococcaceae bacterium]|nr:glycoside hydrolase family 2 [Oscillospiraceae bacterium]
MNTDNKTDFELLTTPFEADMPAVPWTEYPRPQLKRDSYLCLNGAWQLSCRRGKNEEMLGTITVPFPPESKISGIGRNFAKNDTLIYLRTFSLTEEFLRDRVLLHFGAVDQEVYVFVNGKLAGHHIGGYWPFTLDVTTLLQLGDNVLTAEVTDPLDTDQPYGKQRRKRGGMWYTPTSGIWQTVWMESVPENYITGIKTDISDKAVTLHIQGGDPSKILTVTTPDGEEQFSFEGDTFTFAPENPRLWSPEDPYLYRFTLTCGADTVSSYFAFRTVGITQSGDHSLIALNGKPYFFHGLLDQGYFADGIFMPATPEGFKQDILRCKELGFNMLRKHIKIEPDLFYYYCDLYGMIVFQDMINNGRYSFLRDTALPTIGFKKGLPRRTSRRQREWFAHGAQKTLTLLNNHPCICYYTIFNEGWGQHDADRLYTALKKRDPSRIWDTASGWFRCRNTDVQSEHVYFKPVKLTATADKPLVLSESGGYSCKIEGHAFNLKKTYGYRHFETKEAFADALDTLYRTQIIPAIEDGLCATVLTQVSDVEDEVNGLFTYDRQVCKVEETPMKRLADDLHAAFAKRWLA